MTIIIGYKTEKGLIFASDTQCSNPDIRNIDTTEKVFKTNGIIFGVAGSIALNNELHYNFNYVLPKYNPDTEKEIVYKHFRNELKEFLTNSSNCLDENNTIAGEILVGIYGKLYSIQDDFSIVTPVQDYYCIGCGSTYAFGSIYALNTIPKLETKQKIKLAIESAGEYSMGCNKEVRVYDYTN